MKINVAQLLKAVVGETRSYEIDEDIGNLDGTPTTAPIVGRVRLTRMPDTILVEAKLKTVVVLTCGRCLEEVVQPLRIEFVEEYAPTVDVETGMEIPRGGDDADRFQIDANHILDLTEAVREYGLLAIPMQVVCRPECKGLCPDCGQNLNVADCGHADKVVDHRLAKLKELLGKDE